jgi:hypothetical protein
MMSMTTAETNVRTFEELNRLVYLMSSTVSYWRGHYQIKEACVTLTVPTASGETRQVPLDKKNSTRPQTILLPEAWRKRFQEVETAKGRLEERYTLSMPGLRGVRIIPKSACNNYLEALEEPRRLLNGAVNDFCESFAENMQEIRNNVPAALWDVVRRNVPANPEEFRSKARISTIRVQLNADDDYEVLDHDELNRRSAELRESTLLKAHEAIEAMIAGPREELAKSLQNLAELIARDGRVTERSFSPVRQAVEKLRRFDFMCDEEMLAQVQQMAARLDGVTASELDQQTATENGLFAAITDLQSNILDAEKQALDRARFGLAPRRLNLG